MRGDKTSHRRTEVAWGRALAELSCQCTHAWKKEGRTDTLNRPLALTPWAQASQSVCQIGTTVQCGELKLFFLAQKTMHQHLQVGSAAGPHPCMCHDQGDTWWWEGRGPKLTTAVVAARTAKSLSAMANVGQHAVVGCGFFRIVSVTWSLSHPWCQVCFGTNGTVFVYFLVSP